MKKFKLFFLAVSLLTLVCGILLSSCRAGKPQYADRNIARVVRRDFTPKSVLATGVVKAQVGAEVRVGSRVSGKVERVFTGIGDKLNKGDPIAQLEKDDLEALMAQRRAEWGMARGRLSSLESLFPKEVEKAEADVDKWQATVTLAEKDLERTADLVKEDLSSEQELDQAKEQLAVAEAELVTAVKTLELVNTQYTEDIKLAQLEVESTMAALANARAELAFTTIVAPITGVVASIETQEGETVAAGMNAPTFLTIIDLERLQVDAYVDEVDIGKIEPGQQAVFTVDAFPAREIEGKVEAIYPKAVILENVVYYDVVIEITQPYQGLLRPEMTASVTIFQEERKDVLVIPLKAVKREGGRNVVYLLNDGVPEQREIKVGWQDGRWIEIVSGLEEGQLLLTETPAAVREGS
ncbi:MAG: efflux RND transporter periplasmic adaptor subunit [Candidatus Glassbacteria bacterium]|nr:efflux RND transporter periplasmic adaptor subunit [Candidatus Glassbacteria bacterium]